MNAMGTNRFDEEWDFVVVGSGGGSMCAALAAKHAGMKPLILEKTDLIGGSTSMSGGVMWIPNNSVMAEANAGDSAERALLYLDSLIGPSTPGSTPERRRAFVHEAPLMIDFLRGLGMQFEWNDGYSDYHDEVTGGMARGRSISAKLFNLRELGPHQAKLRRTPFDVPASISELLALSLVKVTWQGKTVACKVLGRKLAQRLLDKDLIGCGTALQGRMFQIALREGIEIRAHSAVQDFIMDGGRVVGVVVDSGGAIKRIGAPDGVLINAGGFARNEEMRRRFGPQPSSTKWTNSNPGDTGEILQRCMDLGAAVDQMDEAVWNMVSLPPGSERMIPMHVPDLGKPGSIVVDSSGSRFANEAASYMEFGQAVYRRHREVAAIPAWYVFDARAARRYPMWAVQGNTESLLRCGYLKRADSIGALANECGIPPAALEATIVRFNQFAQRGMDEDFGRGNRRYDWFYGDPTNKPNPTLGPVVHAPFSAIQIYPGDVGTFGGVVTDEHARVLREDGSVISGLYATGNSTASVVGRYYPGPGASIGASFTFGFVAARHAASARQLERAA